MQVIQPTFEILTPPTLEAGIESLRFIERMARISHRSEEKQTEDSWKRFIEFVVLTKGDWSVVEHASATVLFTVDRGVTHEQVRHRLFSFTQESTRFVNYRKRGEIEFILPSEMEGDSIHDHHARYAWETHMRDCEQAYYDLLDAGRSPQIARSVLPNALASLIAATANLRTWRWFFLARTSREVHPDFLRITIPLLKAFQERIPILYDDIEPLQKQSVSMGKVH